MIGEVAASIRAAARGKATAIVAVDGRGGSGKSTLAERLAAQLGAPVVHTDDFAAWDNPLDWWPELIERALRPLSAGQPARYRPKSWGGLEKEPVEIAPSAFVIVEGVSSSREAFRPYLTYSIWVETPRELCLERGVERDGEEMRPHWERWMAEEDAYIARENPKQRADVVLPGDGDLWTGK